RGLWALDHRCAAGNRRGGERAHPGHRRQRLPPRSDIVKALCIGANAVCIGRPYIWGLGAFGPSGVERVLELLRTETYATMQQVGAPSINQLVPAMVRRA